MTDRSDGLDAAGESGATASGQGADGPPDGAGGGAGDGEETRERDGTGAADGTDDGDGPADSNGAGEDGQDASDPLAVAADHPVLLFDGVCNLCNRWIQFVIQRDPDAKFRYAPLQAPVAQELLDAAEYGGEDLDTVVLVEDGNYYTKSDAVIRTARHLGGVYHLLRPTVVVPTRLRNVLYDFVANRRYDWFGKRDQCMMPTPDIEDRFLAGGPQPGGGGDIPEGEETPDPEGVTESS